MRHNQLFEYMVRCHNVAAAVLSVTPANLEIRVSMKHQLYASTLRRSKADYVTLLP